MASGKTHARIAGVVAVGTAVASPWLAAEYGADAAVGAVAGALMGYLVTPDLDHHFRTHEEQRIKRIPIVGQYWLDLAAGYASRYRHRGVSHVLILGTVTRIWYAGRRLFADALFAAAVVYAMIGTWVTLPPVHLSAVALIMTFVFWCVQDALHILTDRLS